MSREIKFRIWYPNYKKMQTGIDIDFEHACMDIRNGKLIFNIDELDYDEVPEYFAESGYVLMQFTGLLDKNGKEIYEGDIVKVFPSFNLPFISAVFFEEGCFFIDNNIQSSAKTTNNTINDTRIPIYKLVCPFEIIGNIYENPELMDGAK